MASRYIVFMVEAETNSILWSLQIDDIELVAGMLAAGMGIMDDLNYENKSGRHYIDSDVDVSEFRISNDIIEDKIMINTCGVLENGEYGLWMKGNRRPYYNLYRFHTSSFFQGIITICNSFGVDFRNYIYGFPFDGHGNQYALGNYVMAQNQITQDAPDLDDIEDEERDDENIIEPLARTEIIIT